ncbi:hypothetical protein EGW08_012183 [Elysia chlorotica]|uniref:Lipid-binding serum glycoprotein N-terminal domain-containing protein n=1 Tax=Elysia chlorotica TaxID=188477 RepID=A0A3S1BBA7_ELYCH|nr:hypothetical protein EGW08_012183 [Elysia chlorotica]
MKMNSVLVLAGVVLLVHVGLISCTNPGLKIRITKRGLEYVNKASQTLITQQLHTMRIPDSSSRNGKVSFDVTNIRVEGVSIPTAAISLRPDKNGLAVTIGNFGLSVRANYRAARKGW